MAKLLNPVLFSQRFKISRKVLAKAGFVDPILNSDTKLFIDPLLLSTSSCIAVKRDGYNLLKTRFSEIIKLVAASSGTNDLAWRSAANRLDLRERPETCLGYGGASTSGSSRPEHIKQQVLATAKEIIQLGEKDPEIISLIGLFEEGVGPDTISDLTTNIVLPILCEATEKFCIENRVPCQHFSKYGNRKLPNNPFRTGTPVVLVPRDIVRDLPLAVDWSDVSTVVMEIAEIRDAFNAQVANITEATLAERKRALKSAALQSLKIFREFFAALLDSSNAYDPNEDVLNFYAFRELITGDLRAFSGKIAPPKKASKEELARIVDEIVDHFRTLVEKNNLWEMLWNGPRPKRERAAQLLFFAVADVFCRANNLDISPETHSGGGPVDFKFSTGYTNRLLVEVKLSRGQVVHGFSKQLEVYKTAARTDEGIFLVIDVGNMGKKLGTIRKTRADCISRGQKASKIVVVDGRRRKSASKA